MDYEDEAFLAKRAVAREALNKAVEEYIREMHPEAPMLLCTSVVYETTTFEQGDQHYGVQHVMLGSSAMSTHVGLLRVAEKRLMSYMNRKED